MQSFFILGSHPKLSLAEITAVTGMSAAFSDAEVAIFNDIDTELTTLQDKLGGTMKLGTIIGEVNSININELADLLFAQLFTHIGEKKVTYGVSIYGDTQNHLGAFLKKGQKALGLEIKKRLRDAGRSARYVVSRNPQLSSADLLKNKVLERGTEFCFIIQENRVLIGQTEAFQNIDDWSYRDFERPTRHARRGMLPPKLARIMVNLAGTHTDDAILLDPFCGVGTVLMEASLAGYTHVMGSDIDQEAVNATETNLTWLADRGFPTADYALFTSAAANLHAHIPDNSISAIVTEPFLGTPRRGNDTSGFVEAEVQKLFTLYDASLATLSRILKDDGVMVIVMPVHYINGQPHPLDTETLFSRNGLIPVQAPIRYQHKGQFVGRDIFTLKKH